MKEIYVSVDIETEGPSPGKNSMLSFAAAAFQWGDRKPIATFEANLTRLPNAVSDPDTMTWWEGNAEAYAYATANPQDPGIVIPEFAAWVRQLPGSPVLVTYPTWDAAWMTYYIGMYYDGKNPFGISSLDIKSLAMGALRGGSFKRMTKKVFPKEWFTGAPKHTHKAIDDAIGQGVLLMHLLEDLS